LAEDAPANRVLSMHVLQGRGHTVTAAADGEKAVQLALAQDFDVVLMDVQMPVLDGFQATEAIRALPDPKKAALPIIALTAHALKDDLERCLEVGMNAYLSKPFQPAELIEVVERVAGQHASNALSETGGTRPEVIRPHDAARRQDAAPSASAAVFNLAVAVARTLGKYDLFRQMVDFFYQEADPLVARMRSAVAGGDAEDLIYAVHRLKGTILYLGSHRTMESADRLERIGRSGDLAPAADALRELEQWIERLKIALAPHRHVREAGV
jgi:CheY-like chemotaxis protein/HPt (histidine-containing phosphotransfer) domain-containing protein